MMLELAYAINRLQPSLPNADDRAKWSRWKAECLARYQPCFSPTGIESLSESVFLSFLEEHNNKHWGGLHRLKGHFEGKLPSIRTALAHLLEEAVPIEGRIGNLLTPSSSLRVPYLGKATLTAILHVAHPDKYGVWNGITEDAFRDLGISFTTAASKPGLRYGEVNGILNELAESLGIDLWTLDFVFCRPLGREYDQWMS